LTHLVDYKSGGPAAILRECTAMNDNQSNAECPGEKAGLAWCVLSSAWVQALRRPWRVLGIGALVSLIGLVGIVISLYVQSFMHFRSGRSALERHHNVAALDHFQIYLRSWPQDPEALLLSARACWRLQQFEAAERYLRKYQQAGGSAAAFDRESFLLAAARGEIERAEKYFQRALKHPEAATPLILEALVSGCLRQERLVEGMAFLQRWLELQPENTQALLFQAHFDRLQQDVQEALATYRRILQLDPEQDAAKLPLAEILMETRQYEAALPLLDSLRQRQPHNEQVLVLLAQCQDFLGRQDEAEELLDQVLAQAPNHAAALAVRGQLALHKGQLAAAETWLRQALAHEPGNYRVKLQLAECLLQQGRMDEVYEQRQQLRQMEEDQKRLHLMLTQEMSRRPRDPSLYREVAMILLRNGNAERGLRVLQNALRQDPTSVSLRQALTEYYQQMNRSERSASPRSFGQRKINP